MQELVEEVIAKVAEAFPATADTDGVSGKFA